MPAALVLEEGGWRSTSLLLYLLLSIFSLFQCVCVCAFFSDNLFYCSPLFFSGISICTSELRFEFVCVCVEKKFGMTNRIGLIFLFLCFCFSVFVKFLVYLLLDQLNTGGTTTQYQRRLCIQTFLKQFEKNFVRSEIFACIVFSCTDTHTHTYAHADMNTLSTRSH